jgi:branched-chain amino acid aminotransferase
METYYVDGQFVPAEKAVLPVDDLAIIRGVGVFDFLRTHGQRPYFLAEHVARLENSARQIGLELPWSAGQISRIVLATLDHNRHLEEANIRIVVTGGSSPDFITPQGKPRLIVLVTPFQPLPAEWYRHGIKIVTICCRRDLPQAKSIDYIRATMALRQAKAAGAVEAVYLDRERHILEGTTSNVFAVVKGRLVTPGRDILPGITRQAVLDIGRDLMECRIRDIALDELLGAEEAFLTGTSKGLMPVVQVDETLIGSGTPGPNTRRLMAALDRHARQHAS